MPQCYLTGSGKGFRQFSEGIRRTQRSIAQIRLRKAADREKAQEHFILANHWKQRDAKLQGLRRMTRYVSLAAN